MNYQVSDLIWRPLISVSQGTKKKNFFWFGPEGAGIADAHLVEVAAAELGFVDDAGVVDGALRLWPWHVAGDVGGCDAHYAARARKGDPE